MSARAIIDAVVGGERAPPPRAPMSTTAVNHPAPAAPAAAPTAVGARTGWPLWLAVALITAAGAALRLADLGAVVNDPFYDAAVRSMSRSWHNFFFGAFEPGGSVSIDKPPVDLWLQVVSVKLFGFGSAALKLPEALAGTLSIPLLYEAVRRVFGPRAGLASAVAMAALPIEVVTARSDTMDALMMLMLVIALLFAVRAAETGSTAWLLAGAAALGVAFNVKLLESVIALPGLGLFALLGLPGPGRRRLLQVVLAVVVYVVVALSWLGATLLVPAAQRPYAIGSTNGSAWNAAFVFNGSNRVSGPQPSYGRFKDYPTATQSERDHIPITPPSATRLLTRIGPLSGGRLGLELLVGVLLGVPSLLLALGADRLAGGRRSGRSATPQPRGEPNRVARAAAAGLLLWLVLGAALFSQMGRLHPRYVEGFTPAVAAVMGIGVAWASRAGSSTRFVALAVALGVTVVYGYHLLFGATVVWAIVAVTALAALAAAALALQSGRARLGAAALALTLVAVMAIPVQASIQIVQQHVTDAGRVGALPADYLRAVSRYLRDHQGRARYEVAAASSTIVGALIVKDARPVLMLTTYDALPFTSVVRLKALIRAGQVRYALITSFCGAHTSPKDAACSAPARWVRAHATDVSRAAGLTRGAQLYRLPGALA